MNRTERARWISSELGIRVQWLLVATCWFGIAGCYAVEPLPQNADTNTNWLVSCQQQSDCGDGLSCVGGHCMSEVAVLDAGALDRRGRVVRSPAKRQRRLRRAPWGRLLLWR